jgi:NADH:ubiquinone oxidoreductase subunit H
MPPESNKPEDKIPPVQLSEAETFYRSNQWFSIFFGNKYFSSIFLAIICASAFIGGWAVYQLSQGQFILGTSVLVFWAPVYWLFMKHLNSRKVMRIGFSITVTLLVLALVFYLGKHQVNPASYSANPSFMRNA